MLSVTENYNHCSQCGHITNISVFKNCESEYGVENLNMMEFNFSDVEKNRLKKNVLKVLKHIDEIYVIIRLWLYNKRVIFVLKSSRYNMCVIKLVV